MREEEKNKNAVTSHVHGTRADRAQADQDAEIDEQLDRIRRRARK
jgi:hypothetical protein